MKKFLVLSGALAGILLFSGCGSKGWKTIDGVIVFDTPAREPGQESVLGLRTAPMETVRVGFVGLGMRGPGAVERFTHLDGVEIKALCDLTPSGSIARRRSSRVADFPRPRLTAAKRAGNSSASAATSTSSTSSPRGRSTCRWRSTP